MRQVRRLFSIFHTARRGVTALEYGLIAAIIAAFLLQAFNVLGTSIEQAFANIGTALVALANAM